MFTKNLSFLSLKTIFFVVVSLFMLNGCIPNQQNTTVVQKKDPGLYSIKGWNYSSCYCPKGDLCNCSAKDIDGKVGYSFYINGPRANCVPSGNWTMSYTNIISGELPPGLSFDGQSNIKGIPEKRGHWIVDIEVRNLYCGGVSYFGIKQQLRFHISGSGKVNY